MSDELRAELTQWRAIGQDILNQLDDWSSGRFNKDVYISKGRRTQIEQLLGIGKEVKDCEPKHLACALGNKPCPYCGEDSWVGEEG